ncbi:DNA topoisomerase III [Saccharophagus degradans]|uniref:DNA topoisomerase III n=1 Tax=Saccharophagus degradans TaxID=86304 RepID=UPI0024780ED1|nr:DNA topoisomerase III [Saccharophagus degradans]WGO97007.1 DNA topoisomerase III [Saccharophagus degradans]
MRLFIAEKPSLGRAIADVLPKPHSRGDGFIRCGNGDVVSWCIGHLLEQAEPEAYNPVFKQWRLEHLPIIPDQWQLKPKSKTRKQLTALRKLVKEATCIVHAGDPDREGQLLVDQVIDFLGVKGAKRESVQRCLINDLNPAAVKRSLDTLRSNKEFIPLATSALARSRADWLYGINMTRAYTLQGRKVGYEGLLSVGRVQTPILGMVVERDRAIEEFVSKPFYEVLAHLTTLTGEPSVFTAKWLPSEACEPYMDEDGRVLSKKLAQNVIARITGENGVVEKVDKKAKAQAAPLPYNLSSLQIDAAKRFAFAAQKVLDICQNLYEKHKLITYPRSDSRYLPADHWHQANDVLQAISANVAELVQPVSDANSKLKSKAWNDAKVDAHHAIIPTAKKVSFSSLTSEEQKVYSLIARQYVCQFYPKWEYSDTVIHLKIAGGQFVSKARLTHKQGWKVLFERKGSEPNPKDDDEFPSLALPDLHVGQSVACRQGELLEKQTQPPKYFTDASLLAAMTGIARYVTDPDIKKILKDTDGLGTEATRAGIIELLFKRNFLVRKGKQIHSTPAARGLVAALPSSATTPDMTAQWELALNAISKREAQYTTFMQPLVTSLQTLIAESQRNLPIGLKGVAAKPKAFKRRRKAKAKSV